MKWWWKNDIGRNGDGKKMIGDKIVVEKNDRRQNGDEKNSMGRNDDDEAI